MEATELDDGARAVLREPAERVSRRAVLMWTVEALVVAAVVLAGQVAWWFIDSSPSRTAHWVVGVVWLVAAVAYAAVMPRWRYRVHRWESTARAVYTQTGWLWQERRIAPLSRVQTVDLERGPVAQLLGLASVTVTTASAAGPVRIHGLDLAVATALVQALTTATAAETDDAT
ncbi:PH domain-containing protein [Terrabacter sp. 2RAF25]|uniref:PH domain-containing protein n=1 Tax=Terrabacter sp. 2RAF25 TaxID=3232998 RepID=UPI003F9D6DA8